MFAVMKQDICDLKPRVLVPWLFNCCKL